VGIPRDAAGVESIKSPKIAKNGDFGYPVGMGVIERKGRLFDSIVRLRRAERRAAPDEDVVAVRAMLEAELGETVSRRLAARLLGLDHKALERWIRSGDLPVVYTPSGRLEIPVPALLGLYEDVAASRSSGQRSLHHLEPSLIEGRRRAEALRPDELIEAGDAHGHERAERRSLAYHRAVAKRLRRAMADEALRVVWTWREHGRIADRYADEWERLLRRPVPEIARMISEDTQRGRDLRQNSPFAGVLSEAERRRINEAIR
jgi:hypothetical protein